MDELTAITSDLPHLEVVVEGCPDGYRATATFGAFCFVATDDELDWAAALATAGLEAMIASARTR